MYHWSNTYVCFILDNWQNANLLAKNSCWEPGNGCIFVHYERTILNTIAALFWDLKHVCPFNRIIFSLDIWALKTADDEKGGTKQH
jgi:hypothetical protein